MFDEPAPTSHSDGGPTRWPIGPFTRAVVEPEADDYLTSCPSSKSFTPGAEYGLHPMMEEKWQTLSRDDDMGADESVLFHCMSSYRDVLFYEQSHINGDKVRKVAMLHLANHVRKAHNRWRWNMDAITVALSSGTPLPDEESVRDQGPARTRVLVLCAFRSIAFNLASWFTSLLSQKKTVRRLDLLTERYLPGDDSVPNTFPEHAHLFSGSSNDRFVFGAAVSRRSVTLFTRLAESDIIFASPLGLRGLVKADHGYTEHTDLLSSVEIMYVDRADALKMQNWEHVLESCRATNCPPVNLGQCDIRRLRRPAADGLLRAYRQTIVFADGKSPDFLAILNEGPRTRKQKRNASVVDGEDELRVALGRKHSDVIRNRNHRGTIRLSKPCSSGVVSTVTASGVSKQAFLSVQCTTLVDTTTRHLKAFEERFWNAGGSSLEGLVIIVPSYLELISIRKLLRNDKRHVAFIYEYTNQVDLRRLRREFNKRSCSALITTERYFWYRPSLPRFEHIFFFKPLETPALYVQIMRRAINPSCATVLTLFSRFDVFALERLCGESMAKKMAKSEGNKLFAFC
mmetsp:Transcript_92206/g.246529  ORF Transcript_92206/g.246529 Transcript_92206/m.246529 type:complete len:571 (-) Transcript_92206:53-1765(-)